MSQVRTLCDIGELCRHYGDTLAWRQLVVQAHTYAMEKPLYYALTFGPGIGHSGRAVRGTEGIAGELWATAAGRTGSITAVARRALLTDDQDTQPLSFL